MIPRLPNLLEYICQQPIFRRISTKLIHELAQSAAFIENLDQFLQYIQIPCPQIRFLSIDKSHFSKADFQ